MHNDHANLESIETPVITQKTDASKVHFKHIKGNIGFEHVKNEPHLKTIFDHFNNLNFEDCYFFKKNSSLTKCFYCSKSVPSTDFIRIMSAGKHHIINISNETHSAELELLPFCNPKCFKRHILAVCKHHLHSHHI